MLIVGGSASQKLAEKVSRLLGAELAKTEIYRFTDGECYVRIKTPVKGRETVLIQSTYPPQDAHLIELFLLTSTCRDLGAENLRVIVPYLAYARQDKQFKEGEALSIKTIANLIVKSGAEEIFCIDLHEKEIVKFFDVPIHNLHAAPLIGKYLAQLSLKNPIVVGADQGAASLAQATAKEIDADYDYLEKTRIGIGEVEVKPKSLDVAGRDIILMDDIIDTGGTMAEDIKLLQKQKANKICAACIHPLLSKNASQKILAAGAQKIIGTNTIPRTVSVVSVAPLIVDSLR